MAYQGLLESRSWSLKLTHHNGCVAATFFVHFFYLSVFFWMLAKALLILYGILIVFHTLSKSALVASLFSVGYGCPLIIAAITVAVTEPNKGYLRPDACWLNWDRTKALLAFVVPALAIVVVNLITVTLVIVKTQRAAIGSSMFQEVRAIVRISKNIAILTPLLGLTWGFGIATVITDNSLALHIIFSLLNAFQVSPFASQQVQSKKISDRLCERKLEAQISKQKMMYLEWDIQSRNKTWICIICVLTLLIY